MFGLLRFKREIFSLPLHYLILKDDFLEIQCHDDLAIFFGYEYPKLAKLIYKLDKKYRYHQFQISKKSGDTRLISSPCKELKQIQAKLNRVLAEIYEPRPSIHGFVEGKSIVTNARKHLDKRFIFNIDLERFFESIHFGRVRNLFKSAPFDFNRSVATILAQICCFENTLPQGAPTSPIVANIICWKLDSQLQHLAKNSHATYTRYADDLSFSFTCSRSRLPRAIVVREGENVYVGDELNDLIKANGFKVNEEKVRLCSKLSRMEVTGLTVNKKVNVRRQYVKQISSMLHAWRKFGYEAAEIEFNSKYSFRHRASDKPRSFLHVIKGKLSFLRSVRTGEDPIFNKLATQFNRLVDENHKFRVFEFVSPDQQILDSLWVFEALYDDENGEAITSQGTAFSVKGVGIVTCAHVVLNSKGELHKECEVFQLSDPSKKFQVRLLNSCTHRDIAICEIIDWDNVGILEISNSALTLQMPVTLIGFPGYSYGQSHYIVDSKVAKILSQNSVDKFELDKTIRKGNSGGPILDSNRKVIGMALEGEYHEGGKNGCLSNTEINKFINDFQ